MADLSEARDSSPARMEEEVMRIVKRGGNGLGSLFTGLQPAYSPHVNDCRAPDLAGQVATKETNRRERVPPGQSFSVSMPGWETCIAPKRHAPGRRWNSETPSSQIRVTVLALPPMCCL